MRNIEWFVYFQQKNRENCDTFLHLTMYVLSLYVSINELNGAFEYPVVRGQKTSLKFLLHFDLAAANAVECAALLSNFYPAADVRAVAAAVVAAAAAAAE